MILSDIVLFYDIVWHSHVLIHDILSDIVLCHCPGDAMLIDACLKLYIGVQYYCRLSKQKNNVGFNTIPY